MKHNLSKSPLNLRDETALLFAEGIVDTVREPILVLDSDLRVISCNNSFYDYFMVNPDVTVGELIYDLGNGQWDIPVLRRLLKKLLPNETFIQDFEVSHNFEDIGDKTLLINARMMKIKNRDPLILISIQDITQRKLNDTQRKELLERERLLTEELTAINEELRVTTDNLHATNEKLVVTQDKQTELLNKLTSSNRELEQFAYIASHDLQEPLRMISSFNQLLEKRYKDKLDADAEEYIDFIVGGVQRMKDLIDDLLLFSRINTEAKKFDIVKMGDVLDNVLTDLKESVADNNAQIIHEPLPIIKGDPSQIHQLLQNLLSNAIKFHGKKPPIINISVKELEKEWVFGVSDNGIGISPKHQEQIFNIFKRLHTIDEYSGTGIGLAICKKIVERHGGSIWVESESDKGSTFYFNIPKRQIYANRKY